MIRDRQAAAGWWRELQPDPTTGHSGDRATLARLRRCATPAELMLEPATIVLFRRCKADAAYDLPPVALVAGVLAHVRADDRAQSVARRVGPEAPEKPETALLKPLRFRWLMEARSADERLIVFRRLVALADRTLNVRDLAEALLDWREERPWSEERQRRWVFDYWNADPLHQANTPTPNVPLKDTVA
jgi:CRISPR system Cascade subunit CasB